MQLNITNVSIVLENGLASVAVYTLLPSPFGDAAPEEGLFLKFAAPAHTAVQYCREHFGIEPEVFDARYP